MTYRGINYRIRLDGNWQWEVLSRPSTVIAMGAFEVLNGLPVNEYAWHRVADAAARKTIDVLIEKGLVVAGSPDLVAD